MMPNRSTDILFQLIKSLEKAEKRHFKLYINRSSGKEDLKIVRLFDALDKQKDYDERLFRIPAKYNTMIQERTSIVSAFLSRCSDIR